MSPINRGSCDNQAVCFSPSKSFLQLTHVSSTAELTVSLITNLYFCILWCLNCTIGHGSYERIILLWCCYVYILHLLAWFQSSGHRYSQLPLSGPSSDGEWTNYQQCHVCMHASQTLLCTKIYTVVWLLSLFRAGHRPGKCSVAHVNLLGWQEGWRHSHGSWSAHHSRRHTPSEGTGCGRQGRWRAGGRPHRDSCLLPAREWGQQESEENW